MKAAPLVNGSSTCFLFFDFVIGVAALVPSGLADNISSMRAFAEAARNALRGGNPCGHNVQSLMAIPSKRKVMRDEEDVFQDGNKN